MREKLSQKYSLYFTTGSSAFQRFDKLGLKNIKLFLLANVQSNAKKRSAPPLHSIYSTIVNCQYLSSKKQKLNLF